MNSNKMRFLITGAAGTIGSALVEFYLSKGFQVCALDNNEDGLFKLGRKFANRYSSSELKLFFGDVRDVSRLRHAFEGVDVVIHAAALKHVELSEYNVLDCVETNVSGVRNVIVAAIDAKVSKVVFTSSDKAVNPSSTMGGTKLLGERMIIAANNIIGRSKIAFSSVRFGNVLDSNGSVLSVFRECVEQGKPFPITHKDMTRFFLNIKDAVDLVSYAVEYMRGGEIFVKTMGSAHVTTLAKAIAGTERIDTYDIGVKAGEKLFEELVTVVEANRTYMKDGFYIIVPDALHGHEHFGDFAEGLSTLTQSLSSEDVNLDWRELKDIVDSGYDLL